MTTRAPSRRKASVSARPRPRAPPVTRTACSASAGTVREVGSRVGEAMVSRSFRGRRARPPHSGWEHIARGAVPGRGTAWERTRGPDRRARGVRARGEVASAGAAGGACAVRTSAWDDGVQHRGTQLIDDIPPRVRTRSGSPGVISALVGAPRVCHGLYRHPTPEVANHPGTEENERRKHHDSSERDGAAPTMATMTDIAREAGVSLSTVSYALSGKRPISAETRERIQSAIARLEYHPAASARALALKRTSLIGVAVPQRKAVDAHVIMEFVSSFLAAAHERDFDILLVTAEDHERTLRV